MAEELRGSRVAERWWRALQPDPKHADPSRRTGDRAALARLRRCTTIAQAASEPEALGLARNLGAKPQHMRGLENALLAAIVLSHVRETDSEHVARRLGGTGAEQRAPMSPLRLARLLSAETMEERLLAFRRLVALLGGRVHVENLAHALLDWSETTRIAWAFEYHSVAPPGTDISTNPEKNTGGDVA